MHCQTTSNQMYTVGALAVAIAAAAEQAEDGGNLYNHNNADQLPMIIPSKETTVTLSLGGSDDEDHEEDVAERRMTKSRARNREHARKTRLRKKAQLEQLQGKVESLQAESKALKQSLLECSIASILLGLSSGGQDGRIQTRLKDACNPEDVETSLPAPVGVKRKRFVPDDVSEKQAQPLRLKIGGHTHMIGGGRANINWKSGVYSDDNGVQKQLTQKQLGSLRRERNRMHAKMTRDRKKSFIATIEKTIADLKNTNQHMKNLLTEVTQTPFQFPSPRAAVTPISSPQTCSVVSHEEIPSLEVMGGPPRKRLRHGSSSYRLLAEH